MGRKRRRHYASTFPPPSHANTAWPARFMPWAGAYSVPDEQPGRSGDEGEDEHSREHPDAHDHEDREEPHAEVVRAVGDGLPQERTARSRALLGRNTSRGGGPSRRCWSSRYRSRGPQALPDPRPRTRSSGGGGRRASRPEPTVRPALSHSPSATTWARPPEALKASQNAIS